MTPTEERKLWLARQPQTALAGKLNIAAWITTALVLTLVGLMRRPDLKIPLPDGLSFGFLPPFHASINALAALVLIGALLAVKAGRIALHRRLIITAMALSVLFLLSYVAYHFTTVETRYGGEGIMKSLYLVLLISHIVLAGISLPLILLTFIAGWTNQFSKHRRLARWIFPIWLYVAITGPICYLMLRPYY